MVQQFAKVIPKVQEYSIQKTKELVYERMTQRVLEFLLLMELEQQSAKVAYLKE
jgi:hypothetical protein